MFYRKIAVLLKTLLKMFFTNSRIYCYVVRTTMVEVMQDESIFIKKKYFFQIEREYRLNMIQRKKGKFVLEKKQDILHGERALRFPLISLTAQRQMGPYRHVLSQKVVAGIMAIHPPFEKQTTQTITKTSRIKFWRK